MTTEATGYSVKTIESLEELDRPTLHDLFYLTRYLPDSSGLQGSAHSDIEAQFKEFMTDETAPAALLIAEQGPLGRAVGFAGVHIEEDETAKIAELTQLALVPEGKEAKDIGKLLLDEVAVWGAEHEAQRFSAEHVEFTGRVVGREILTTDQHTAPHQYAGQYLG